MKTSRNSVRLALSRGGTHLKAAVATVGLFLVAVSAALATTDYAPAIDRMITGCTKWYTSGYGHKFCVVHDMEGYYYTGTSYLRRCDISVSCHYTLNGLTDSSDNGAPPGEIAQLVRESYYAWHATCWNQYSYGCEHEGFVSNPAWFTEAMYQASAALYRHFCDKSGIAKDRNHIVGHDAKKSAAWCTWAEANLGIDAHCNTHTDPGTYWDWTYYMSLILGQANGATLVSTSVPASVHVGQSFTATITMHNSGTRAWTTGSPNIRNHKLGSQSPKDNTTWGFSRVALPSSTINPGANATFTLNATAPTTPGNYTFAWKMVQDSVEWFGDTFSTTISVINAGPTITTQPASKTVNPGVNTTFTVAATGSGTLTYQWRKDGSNLSNGTKYAGVTTSSLTITNVQQTDVGNYSVAVTDANGTVVSSSAALTVNAVVAFSENFESGLGGWSVFPRPGTALTSSTTQYKSSSHSAYVDGSWDRMYRNLGIRVDGKLRITAWVYDSTQTRSFVDMRGYSGGTFNSGSLIQLFCAGKYNTVTMSGETWDVTKYQGRVVAGSNTGWFNLNGAGAPSRSTGWHKFVIERRSDGTTIDFYVDDILSRTITGATAYSLDSAAIGSVGSGGSNVAGDSWIDDVKVEYFDLPVITTPPTGRTVAAGANTTFSVVAVNTVGSYQWRKNGTNISGATTSSFTLNNVQGSDAATYDVVVANGAGPVDTADAVLKVSPTIITQPTDSTNLPLATATFTVVAAGQTPLSYQWRKDGMNLTDDVNLSGAVSATLTVDGVTPQDSGSYSVVVTNIAGSVTSSVALLVPVLLPAITTPPEGQTVAAGADVTFSVTAEGTPPLFYQWSLNGEDIPGATGTSYTRFGVQFADAGAYSVIVSNAAGDVTSDGALLTVNTGPTLTTISDQTVAAGQTISFTAQASDIDADQDLTFSLDPGAPGAATIVSTNGDFSWATTAADAGTTNQITVRVTDSGTPALSDTKTFTAIVLSAPITISLGVSNQELTIGWNCVSGLTYRVEYKNDWGVPAWSSLPPDVTATGSSASVTDSFTNAQRFYRIRLLP